MSAPININDKNRYFNPPKTEYLFKIILYLKDIEKPKEIIKLTTTKYVKLLNFNDDIQYNKIKHFKIFIQNISNMITYNYESNFDIDEDEYEDESYKTFKNTEVYVEFNKNISNLTECSCYLNANDNNRIFVTPPNY